MSGGVRTLMAGIVLLLAGLAASWAQDVAAPWINAGEAQLGSTLTFTSGGGDYRVITSGPTRPALESTACTVVTSHERELRVLGGQDVNPNQRLGVSRVLGFEAPAGTTRLTCADRFLRASRHGRFQVVSADGPVSIAVVIAFILGGLLLVAGLLLIARGLGSAGAVGTRGERESDQPAEQERRPDGEPE
jgi:hypothetical protein